MADLKNVIYLSNEDFATLSATGTVTIGGEVLTYDEDCVYITPDAIASHVEAGLMSPDDKIKLDGIASGAQPGTITGITMNGASKGTSGVVDLGTVVTAETDTLSSVLNRGNSASKDVNMNSKDVYNPGTVLLTYNYSTEQTPNTQYYWYRLPLPGSGIGDKYYISISGDNNYPINRGNYLLELSNYSSGTSYSVSLNNLGSTLRDANPILSCAIDTSGYVYIQASVAWTCVMRVTRIMTRADNTTSASYTQVGKGAAGVADGFTPAKMFKECGSARIYNGALDTSSSNVGGATVSADKFIENGTQLSNKYLLLNGSVAMNGNIKYAGSNATTTMVKFYDNTADANGNGIGIGGGGLTIIGGGEAADTTWNGLGPSAGLAGMEQLYLTSDNDVCVLTNLGGGYANRKTFNFSADGSLSAVTFKENGTALTDKYQAKLSSQTAYSAKGTATKVPQITTNSLGQVTNISEVTIDADTVDGKHFTDVGMEFRGYRQLKVGAISVLKGTVTYAELIALTGVSYGSLYCASDQNKYYKRSSTNPSATGASCWIDCTSSYNEAAALPDQQASGDPYIYVKVDTKQKYWGQAVHFYVRPTYDNTSGSTKITGFARSQNNFFAEIVNYNGNKLLGIYQASADTDIYYLKFERYNSVYIDGPMAIINVYCNVDNNITLTYISSSSSEYATVSGYSYFAIPSGGVKSNAMAHLVPIASNTYDLGANGRSWRELYAERIQLNGTTGSNEIRYAGTNTTGGMITFYDNTSDASGNGIGIGGGGITIIGSGESTATAWSSINNPGSEHMYVCSDDAVHLVTNLQNGWADRKSFDFKPDGSFNAPVIQEGGTALSDKYQAKLVSGTNIKTINNNSLLGSGDLTVECDPIPSSDVIDTLYFGRSMTHTPATFMGVVAVPSNSIGKAYLDGFKGNSAVVNQLASLFNHFDYLPTYGTGVFNSGEVTITPTERFGSLYKRIRSSSATLKKGHKYFISVKAKGETASEINVLMLYDGTWHYGYQGGLTSSYTTYTLIVELQNDITTDSYFRIYQDNNTSDWKPTTLRDLMIIDLTINGITSTVSSEVKELLKHKDMDVDSYIPFNAGTLTDSKPTKLYSRNAILASLPLKSIGAYTFTGNETFNNYGSGSGGFICWGIISGAKSVEASAVGNADMPPYTCASANGVYGGTADKSFAIQNAQFLIRDSSITSGASMASALAGKTVYYELATPSSTISQAVIAGLVEHTYSLTMPTLKSAGSVQDESKVGGMKVGKLNMGDKTYTYNPNSSTPYFQTEIDDAKLAPVGTIPNLLCKDYVVVERQQTASATLAVGDMTICAYLSSGGIILRNTTYTDPTTLKASLNGNMLNYELSSPTSFTDSISYPEVFDVYAGGAVEVVGNGCDATVDIEWIS